MWSQRQDVVLMDVRMPGTDGVAATHAVINEGLTAQSGQPVGNIILTTYHIDEAVYAALRASASGFLLKDAAPAEIVNAIRAVAASEAWLNPAVTRRLIDEFATRPEQHTPTSAEMAQLTPREREVLTLLDRGMSNADVAAQLFISEATVKTHLAHMMMTELGKHSAGVRSLTDGRPGPLFADRAGRPDVVSHLRPATDPKKGDSGHLRRYRRACRPPIR